MAVKVIAMDVTVRDAMFCQHSVVDVGRGQDHLIFERCIFTGGYVHVDPEIDRQIFIACSFQGTEFTGQPLTARISTDSHWQPAATEASIPKRRVSLAG